MLITGERFDDFGDVKCRFGAVDVPAVYHHRGAALNAVNNAVVWGLEMHPTYLWTLPM